MGCKEVESQQVEAAQIWRKRQSLQNGVDGVTVWPAHLSPENVNVNSDYLIRIRNKKLLGLVFILNLQVDWENHTSSPYFQNWASLYLRDCL